MIWLGIATVIWLCMAVVILVITLTGSGLVTLAAQLIPLAKWFAREGDGAE